MWTWKPSWSCDPEQLNIFIPTSHGGSIRNLASNGLVDKKFESVESEWPWTKVNEWPWPSVVINRHILIYMTICINSHLTDAQADVRLCCSHMAKTGFLMTWLVRSWAGLSVSHYMGAHIQASGVGGVGVLMMWLKSNSAYFKVQGLGGGVGVLWCGSNQNQPILKCLFLIRIVLG